MSDNRKVLVAKRKDDRSKCHNITQNFRNQQLSDLKRGIKRSGSHNATPQKNLANDRLKRLRTSLNEEVQKATPINRRKSENSSRSNNRKRQNELSCQGVTPKLPKSHEIVKSRNEDAFVFNEDHVHQKYFSFGAHTSIFNQKTTEEFAKTVEDMEWCPADNFSVKTTDNLTTHPSNISNIGVSQHEFLIVVDSNIFISHLQTIKNILSMNVTGNVKPVIFIPWMVLEELDLIKGDRNGSLKFKAQEAIKFVENKLSSGHERIRGQTLDEVNQQKSTGKSQDNKIIASCLQILERNTNMILLTGDINLKNKAHFNNIPVCSNTEIMMKISKLSQTKYQMIINKMTTLCTTVINECAKNAYGSASVKMPICQTPKNSLQDCILIFNKYWFSVFQEVLMKQFKKALDDLSTFLNANSSNSHNCSDHQINELVRLCVRVCLFLKDVDCCKSIIESTICDLNNIKES